MISGFIKKLLDGGQLSRQEAQDAFDLLMGGEVPASLAGGFLTALRFAGETPETVGGAAASLRKRGRKVALTRDIVADTCGTGGDYTGTFNISTIAAIVAASCGVAVAKHGNRAVSSRSGSADVLERAGVKIDIGPEKVARMIEECSFAFLFPPLYHPAMKQVAGVRKELGFRTIFNIIGPLCNPANANVQVLGVGDRRLLDVIPQVLTGLGVTRCWVVSGDDGTDEMSVAGPTQVVEVCDGVTKRFTILPEDAGLRRSALKDLAGGSPEDNLRIMLDILSGRELGPKKDAVVLNAGAVIYLSGGAPGLREGVECADASLRKGRGRACFEKIIESSHHE
jgi:anthranilate phosphoribosyltransferase